MPNDAERMGDWGLIEVGEVTVCVDDFCCIASNVVPTDKDGTWPCFGDSEMLVFVTSREWVGKIVAFAGTVTYDGIASMLILRT